MGGQHDGADAHRQLADDIRELRREMREGLGEVLDEQRKTNGHVATVWRELYGDPARHEPGLKAEHQEIREVVLDARAVVRALKWAVPLTPLLMGVGAGTAVYLLG